MSDHYEQLPFPPEHLTIEQDGALRSICERYEVTYDPDDYHHTFDIPEGWSAGWVGGIKQQQIRRTIYIACSPEGEIHS